MLDTHCKRKDDAESLYRRAIIEEPSHPFALYNLALLLEERLALTATANISGVLTSVIESDILAADDDSESKANDDNAQRIFSDPDTDPVMHDQNIEEVRNLDALNVTCKKSPKVAATRVMLIAEVRDFYKRAVDADPTDAATAADFGRYSDPGPLILVLTLIMFLSAKSITLNHLFDPCTVLATDPYFPL